MRANCSFDILELTCRGFVPPTEMGESGTSRKDATSADESMINEGCGEGNRATVEMNLTGDYDKAVMVYV